MLQVGQSTGEESDPPQDLPITWPPGMQQGKLSGLSLLFVSALILLSICVGLQLASAAALNLDHLDYIVLPGLIGGKSIKSKTGGNCMITTLLQLGLRVFVMPKALPRQFSLQSYWYGL